MGLGTAACDTAPRHGPCTARGRRRCTRASLPCAGAHGSPDVTTRSSARVWGSTPGLDRPVTGRRAREGARTASMPTSAPSQIPPERRPARTGPRTSSGIPSEGLRHVLPADHSPHRSMHDSQPRRPNIVTSAKLHELADRSAAANRPRTAGVCTMSLLRHGPGVGRPIVRGDHPAPELDAAAQRERCPAKPSHANTHTVGPSLRRPTGTNEAARTCGGYPRQTAQSGYVLVRCPVLPSHQGPVCLGALPCRVMCH